MQWGKPFKPKKRLTSLRREMEKRDTTSFERERERDKVSNDNKKVKKRG